MNALIAREAVEALTATGYPTTGGYCEKFVRLVVENSGDKAAAACMDNHASGTATETAESFGDTAYVVWDRRGENQTPLEAFIEAGDLLYKDEASSGIPEGHTGIAFHNLIDGEDVLCVAENSTFHIKHPGEGVGYGSPSDDARGWRTFDDFCHPAGMALVVRI